MLDVRYKGLRLIPSKAAMREMFTNGLALADCKAMLEEGYPSPRKRAKGTEERWLDKGKKTYNLVVVRSFNFFYNEEVYLVTHIGKFTKKKGGKIK